MDQHRIQLIMLKTMEIIQTPWCSLAIALIGFLGRQSG